MKKLARQAFTLIELLVVIAIIGILSGLIVVSMGGMAQKATIAKAQVFSNSLKNSLMLNLVSEWKFDEGSGITTADSWSGGNAGTLVCPSSNCWKSGSSCINGSCLYFPGNDLSYLNIADSSNLSFGDVTVSFWAYNGSASHTTPTLYNKGAQGNLFGYWWAYTSGTTINWQYANGTSHNAVSWSNIFPVNVWSYLAFVYDNTNKTVQLFVNGIAQNKINVANALPVTSGTLYFGSYQSLIYSTYSFGGSFDEIRIYNALIPTSQVKEQYYAGLNKMLANGNINNEEYKQRIEEISLNK